MKIEWERVMDIQPHESVAALAAGKQAGQYLESIQVFDLRELTSEQWQTLCEVMCVNYAMELIKE